MTLNGKKSKEALWESAGEKRREIYAEHSSVQTSPSFEAVEAVYYAARAVAMSSTVADYACLAVAYTADSIAYGSNERDELRNRQLKRYADLVRKRLPVKDARKAK